MNAVAPFPRLARNTVFVAALLAAASSLGAQPYDIGNRIYSQNFQIHGQSFTPSVAGFNFSTPASAPAQVLLTRFTFLQSEPSTPAASLYIVPESVFSVDGVALSTVLADLPAYAIAQAGAPVEIAGDFAGQFTGTGPGNYTRVAYDFIGGSTLDYTTTYVALYGGGLTFTQIAGLVPSVAYDGGSVYDSGGPDGDFDAAFVASFAPIPEPGSAALLAGMGAGLLAWRRRRTRA
jgi:hypothetical protein